MSTHSSLLAWRIPWRRAPWEFEASHGAAPPRARCLPATRAGCCALPCLRLPSQPSWFLATRLASVHSRRLLPLTAWLFAAVLVRAGQPEGWVAVAPELTEPPRRPWVTVLPHCPVLSAAFLKEASLEGAGRHLSLLVAVV